MADVDVPSPSSALGYTPVSPSSIFMCCVIVFQDVSGDVLVSSFSLGLHRHPSTSAPRSPARPYSSSTEKRPHGTHGTARTKEAREERKKATSVALFFPWAQLARCAVGVCEIRTSMACETSRRARSLNLVADGWAWSCMCMRLCVCVCVCPNFQQANSFMTD